MRSRFWRFSQRVVRCQGHPDILIRHDDLENTRSVVANCGFIILGGEIPLKPGTDDAGMIFRVSKVDGNQLLPLDIMLVTPAYESVWAERPTIQFEGMRIPVVSRAGMIRMKELGGRRKDLLDLEFLNGNPDAEPSEN